jgi:hypothetical protein
MHASSSCMPVDSCDAEGIYMRRSLALTLCCMHAFCPCCVVAWGAVQVEQLAPA